jgi:hypothetical protein
MKNLVLAFFAILFISSCAEVKSALMENCHLYTEIIPNNKITVRCEENIPIGTCSGLADKVPGAEYEIVPSCSDYNSSSSGS